MILRLLDKGAEATGRALREAIERIGSLLLFFLQITRVMPGYRKHSHLLFEQSMRIGVKSLPLISLISVFIGIITVWQAQYFFSFIIPYTYLGAAVGKAILVDLGPVLTGLVITGRVSAMLASELGSMRVTDQIDAMEVLYLDPFLYLLAPRVLAGFIMMPVLVIYSSFIAIVTSQLIANVGLGVSSATFYNGIKMLFSINDVVVCIVKAFVFGGIITLTGCYFGYIASGGATGVGRATNRAVVGASVLILVSNFVVVSVLL